MKTICSDALMKKKCQILKIKGKFVEKPNPLGNFTQLTYNLLTSIHSLILSEGSQDICFFVLFLLFFGGQRVLAWKHSERPSGGMVT